MSFEYADLAYLDNPPEFQFELGVLPLVPLFVLAGGAVASMTISNWLSNDWSVGEYNNIAREMHDTIAEWDKLGWEKGCWAANPVKRKEWLDFWTRFSKHYKDHGTQSMFLLDSAEKPVRLSLLPQLRTWGDWLNRTCGAATGTPGPVEAPPTPLDTVGKVVMWGALAVGAVAVATVFKSGTRLIRG